MWKARRTAEEVARYLRNFIEGTGADWDWDDFESVTIEDDALESIRQRAADAGPAKLDIERLKQLLAEAETLSAKPKRVR